MGKKNFPIYKIVAADSRSPRDGRFIESIGLYNPGTHPMTIDVKENRVYYWLKNGAQPTDTVRSLFKRKGFLLKWNLMKKGVDEAGIQKAVDSWTLLQSNRSDREIEKKKRSAERKKKQKAVEVKTEEPAAASA